MQLTQDQQRLKNTIRAFYTSPESFLTIDGSAGTGKTTILKNILETEPELNKTLRLLDDSYQPLQLLLTATTNKAVNVLKNQIDYIRDVSTIHSFFGLRPVQGKLTTNKNMTNLAINKFNKIIVIDEASMIDEVLFNYIQILAEKGRKFIFIGDSNQLPPIRSKQISKVFDNKNTVKLTEVVRQQNELLQLATSFKDFVEHDIFPDVTPNGTSIIHVDQNQFESMILQDMSKPGWGIKDSRVLAYSNKIVNHYNALIKKHITGTPVIQEGEAVINNTFVKGKPAINIPTEAEVFVRNITPFQLVNSMGKRYDITYGYKDTTVWMPDSQEELKKLHKHYGSEPFSRNIEQVLADLRPMYASTIHKSQGSTFKRVYIDLNSIKSVQYYDPLMFKRLLYVAVSRASEQVIFTGDII